MPTTTPTLAQLQRALAIAEQIQKLEDELQAVLGRDDGGIKAPASSFLGSEPIKRRPGRPPKSSSPSPTAPAAKSGRKPFSAESKAKMAAAQKARWAAKRGPRVVSPLDALIAASTPTKKGRRIMSPEVKARLAAAMKARWALAKKKGLPPPNARK